MSSVGGYCVGSRLGSRYLTHSVAPVSPMPFWPTSSVCKVSDERMYEAMCAAPREPKSLPCTLRCWQPVPASSMSTAALTTSAKSAFCCKLCRPRAALKSTWEAYAAMVMVMVMAMVMVMVIG